jgi:hypothetical protein
VGDAHFLIPKLPTGILAIAGIGVSWLASVSFSNTIGLGSIITAAVVVVAAGVFTLRNNLKSFWKELAEERGEQVKILTADLKKAADDLVAAQLRHTDEMASFAEEQREVRHQLKTEIATLEGRLKLEQSKHDLSVVTIRLDKIEETLKGRSATFDELAAAVDGAEDGCCVRSATGCRRREASERCGRWRLVGARAAGRVGARPFRRRAVCRGGRCCGRGDRDRRVVRGPSRPGRDRPDDLARQSVRCQTSLKSCRSSRTSSYRCSGTGTRRRVLLDSRSLRRSCSVIRSRMLGCSGGA